MAPSKVLLVSWAQITIWTYPCYWLFDPRTLSQMQPSFNCIDLGSSSLAVSIAGILTPGQELTTYCPLCTKPLPPGNPLKPSSFSCMGSDRPCFHWLPSLEARPLLVAALRVAFPLTANPVHGWALFSLCQAASCPDLCCSPHHALGWGYRGVPEDVNSLQESPGADEGASSFHVPCDFTHQLGREGSREAPSASLKRRHKGLSGAQGRGRSGEAGAGKGEAQWGLTPEGHGRRGN